MTFSSPFTSPARGGAVIPASPGAGLKGDPIHVLDSEDELMTDTSQYSSPFFTQPTQLVNRRTLESPRKVTQPTQLVNRPTLGASAKIKKTSSPASSSSKTEVEVPASSPFQKPKPSGFPLFGNPRLGNMMAPAGTSFRAPPVRIYTKTVPVADKRKHFNLSKDSSDELDRSPPRYRTDSSADERPARGDIRRSSFQRQLSPSPSRTVAPRNLERAAELSNKYDARIQQLARKVYKEIKGDMTLDQCARALEKNKCDVSNAVKDLKNNPIAFPSASSSPSPTLSISSSSQRADHISSSPSTVPPRSTSPPPKRRRLVRGRNPHNSPASSQPQTRPTLISLIDDDEDDDDEEPTSNDKDFGGDYEADEESEDDDSEAEAGSPEKASGAIRQPLGFKRKAKIMEYLNICSIETLAADAKITKDQARHLIDKRPFKSSDQIKAVFQFKTVRGKRTKVPLGEEAFDELVEYMKNLDAIDRIVEHCESQGRHTKSKVSTWKMDQMGKMKATAGAVLPFPQEPKAMQGYCTLQPYQKFGMNWMYQLYSQSFGGILADDMGLGKTCQVVAFISLLVDTYNAGLIREKPWPNLIVVPASVLKNWENEFEKFAPGLSVIKYSGSPAARDDIALQIKETRKELDYHVILTSYTQMTRPKDVRSMNSVRVHAAFFDEGHKLKNPDTKIYNDLNRIQASWKLMITGTPIQNNIMEMVSLLNFLSPQVFGRHREVVEELFTHRASLQQVSEGAVLLSDRVKRARSILEPFILQRKKTDVLADMPTKVRKVVYCDMHDGQKAIYKEFETNYRNDAKGQRSIKGRKNDANNPWIQLRKAAIHPQLFRRFFDNERCEHMARILMNNVSQDELKQPNVQHLIGELQTYSDFKLHLWCRDYSCIRKFDCPDGAWLESGKVAKLLELIQEYEKTDDRALVFTRFVQVVDILKECLAQAGINYCVLQGDTAVAERQELIDAFNKDKSIKVFLLTTKAGGQGINLTAANKVILFDQSDNPQDDIQAENRAHRLGQEREVEVIRLLSKGTIDELVYKACQKKLELAGQITGYGEDISGEDVVAEVSAILLKEAGLSPDQGNVSPPKAKD